MMKKLLITLTTLVFTVVFLSSCDDTREIPNPSGEWKKVTETVSGEPFYLDFETIRKQDGYVYFWELVDYLQPDEFGDLSYKSYSRGDCKLFRVKVLRHFFHKKPMGGGTGKIYKIATVSEWVSPLPNSPIEIILKKVCEYVKLSEEVKFEDLVETNGLYYKKFSDVPFTGKTTGQTQRTYRNGVLDGPWVRYHDNGQLRGKGDFKDGKAEGPWVSYYDKGKLESKGTYKNGKREGPWVHYWENGQLNGKGTYKNGEKEGPWELYHDNGQLKRKGNYKNGKREGPFVLYWENGQLFMKGDYKNGKQEGPRVRYHDNGQLESKGDHKDGKEEGPWVYYHKDGTVFEKYTGTFKNGVKVD